MASKVGTLITYPNYYRGQKALIAGALSGAAFDVRFVDDGAAAASGVGGLDSRVPSLRIDAGADGVDETLLLFDVNAICFRLGDESLRGRSVEEATDVLQWTQFADHELLPPLCAWVFPLLGVIDSDAETVAKAKEECLNLLKVLDDHLLFRTFIIGDRITLADITIFCNLVFLYKHVLSPSVRRPFTCLNRWFKTLRENPTFARHVSDFTWCETEAKLESGNVVKAPKERKTKEKKAQQPPPVVGTITTTTTTTTRPPTMTTKEALFAKLQSLSIEFVTVHHRHVLTVEELVPELGTLPIPGIVGKNLFLKDKKKRNKLYLLTAAHDRPVNLKNVAAALGSAGELRLADESTLLETLGVKQGCVTPFALINDVGGAVDFLLDSIFLPKEEEEEEELAYFHPLTNDATTGVNKADLLRFLDEIGHPPTVLEL